MSNAARIERMRTLLAALEPLELDITDESHLHAGHAGAASGAGHFRMRIVSPRFEGQRLVLRHRLVYDAVHPMMQDDIHALAITAIAPSER
jgi:BolA protein